MSRQNPKGKSHKSIDLWTLAPFLIWDVQSYLRLQPLQSMVLGFIIRNSIDVFGKGDNSNARKWVAIHTTDFANERGYSRQGVMEALSALVGLGIIEVQETLLQTNSGAQRGREFKLVSNQKLQELYELLSTSATPRGDRPDLSPKNVDNSRGDRPDLSPRQAPLVTLTGQACHLVRPHLSPWGVFPSDFSKVKTAQYSLNTLKYFLKTYETFENSFLELYSENANSKASQFKIKTEIASLIRQYSLFSVFIAMSVNLFSKDAQIGDFGALKAFLELNKVKLKEQEEKIHLHSVELFNSILKIHENTPTQDLEIFRENFRQNASVLLIKEEIEQSSMKLFFYTSFHKDIISIFETCNFDLNRFTSEILKKINLYFKFKILGMKNGLNFVQSEEY